MRFELVAGFAARAAAWGAAILLLGGAAQNSPTVPMGTYRAVLQLPGGELPFGLRLAFEGGHTVGYLLNGGERLKLNEVVVNGSHLEIRMPGYENLLTADAGPAGLAGEIVLDKMGGKQQHISLQAQLGRDYRFYPPAAAAAPMNVSGRWAVTFVDDSGAPEADVGEFKQFQDRVTGTMLTATGDHRFLAGQVHGDELYLSTFDGAHAYLYKAKRTAQGLSGDYWSGTAYHASWNAKRDADAKLPDPYTLTRMRPGTQHFDFSFPDLSGRTVSSNDAQFRGKVLIVALAGSWCPNCHDEAAFLSPLYRDYRGKGLEIVSLQFEHFGDFPRAAQATERFRQHYGIEYTTLIAGISDKDDAGKKLPGLDGVYAFPTTIFIDKQGNVRKIHTGFSGPATGEHYTQFVNDVKATLAQMLAER